jgi:hypothetical protein
MVFTNLIMTIHVNRNANWPLMSSMVIGRYKNVNAINPKKWYKKPSTIIIPIFNHKDGHYVRPNNVALKYPDFKKNVDPNSHVKMFNSTVKANVKTYEEYIINAFSYMLKNTILYWCHNYMSKFPNYIFLEFM